jgi:hypothetical protein
MGRTRLRGIELAGIRVAIEVPPNLGPRSLQRNPHQPECSPLDPDLYVGVRVGSTAFPACDSVLYSSAGVTFEIGRHAGDWVVAIHGREPFERVARFDSGFSEGEVVIRVGRGLETPDPLAYPLDELIVLHRIGREGGMVLRGSMVLHDGRALVFIGPRRLLRRAPAVSGSGWKRLGREILDGDRVALRPLHRGVRVHSLGRQTGAAESPPPSARLDAIHAIESSRAVFAERLDEAAAASEILAHAFAPVHDPEGVDRLGTIALVLSRRVPVLRLGLPEERRVVPFTWGQRQAALAFSPPFLP